MLKQLRSAILLGPVGLRPKWLRGAMREEGRQKEGCPGSDLVAWAQGLGALGVVPHTVLTAYQQSQEGGGTPREGITRVS